MLLTFALQIFCFLFFGSSTCFVVQVVIQDPSMCHFDAWPFSAMTCVLVGLGVGLPVSTIFLTFCTPLQKVIPFKSYTSWFWPNKKSLTTISCYYTTLNFNCKTPMSYREKNAHILFDSWVERSLFETWDSKTFFFHRLIYEFC